MSLDAGIAAFAQAVGADQRHLRSQAASRGGLIYPLYKYISNVYTDPDFLRLLSVVREQRHLPVVVIANTASNGPGAVQDANLVAAYGLLTGAGATCIGYVDTNYGARSEAQVLADMDAWTILYGTAIAGYFLDRVGYAPTDTTAPLKAARRAAYHALYAAALARGARYVVANAGGPLLSEWYTEQVFGSDGIVILAEGALQPSEADMAGYSNTHAYLPRKQRGLLLTNQAALPDLTLARKYYGWIGATSDGVFQTTPAWYAAFAAQLAPGTRPFRDVLTSSSDGVQTVFTLAHLPIGDVQVQYGGTLLWPGVDFTLADTALTLLFNPEPSSRLAALYAI